MSRPRAPVLDESLDQELHGEPASSNSWMLRYQLLNRLPEHLAQLPPLPNVVSEVLALAEDPRGDARRMEQVLQQDTLIAGRMLRLANSPYYGRAQPVSRVSQAVVALGHRTVRSLVLAASTAGLLGLPAEALGYTSAGLWLHGLAVGLASRRLAQVRAPTLDPEEVFLAGLLHDAGRLPMLPLLQDSSERWCMARAEGVSAEQFERTLVGIAHGELGREVSKHWLLPDSYQAVAALHHSPPEDHEHTGLIALVHLADVWATARGFGQLEGWNSPVDARAMAYHGFGLVSGLFSLLDPEEETIRQLCAELTH